jgi:DNA-binding transcriptional ArsR family regulator
VKVDLQIEKRKRCFRYGECVADRDVPELLELTDPRAFRAIAHPARTVVIDELYGGAQRTASELAQRTGLTPSAMSYHLRALERWGIVERAEASADGRERPWRRAARRLAFRGLGASDATSDAVVGQTLDQVRQEFTAWRRQVPRESAEWAELGNLSRGRAWLTAEELQRLDEIVVGAVDEMNGRRTPEDHPTGARRVSYLWASTPLVEPGD